MASTKIFKLFFQTEDIGEEPIVRKLILDSSEITFDKFYAKIQDLKEISGEVVTVQYLDQDGDKVTVASNEELIEALTDQVCVI